MVLNRCLIKMKVVMDNQMYFSSFKGQKELKYFQGSEGYLYENYVLSDKLPSSKYEK